MNDPQACAECLRRAQLLAHLAPYIERETGAPNRLAPELLRLGNADLTTVVAPRFADQILDRIQAMPEDRLRAELERSGCWCCCRHDPQFPVGLAEEADAPWALFGRGDPTLLGKLCPELAVTVVGSRKADTYGREVARELGRELAGDGLLVVSGLAFGIDACAHRGALEAEETVAVLGCGADFPSPAAHRSLWRRISEKGLVLSELPPGCGVWRWTFAARDRIMAALSGMTVVVEAAKGSRALLTANLAADLGREVGAVPGPVNSRLSAGPNDLLAGGACLIREAQDVLDAMPGPGVRPARPSGPRLNHTRREVLNALKGGATDAEEIASALKLSKEEATVNLAALEALGYVECRPKLIYAPSGPIYSPSGLEPPDGDELKN
jgi:DNA processing protein